MNTLPLAAARPITRYASAAVLAAVLLAGLPDAAQAQAQDDPLALAPQAEEAPEAPATTAASAFNLATKSARWRANFGKQIAQSLRSPHAAIREQTMINIIYLASRHDDKRDFYPAASGLLRIYERDRNEAHRHMAITALHAVDHAPSMDYLHKRVTSQWEPSKRIYRHTRAVLSDHYKRRYAR